MCFIELVDYDENMAKTQKKATRTRRSKKSAAASEVVEATETVVEEAPKAE
jgi:large subunit ribosomal protein L17